MPVLSLSDFETIRHELSDTRASFFVHGVDQLIPDLQVPFYHSVLCVLSEQSMLSPARNFALPKTRTVTGVASWHPLYYCMHRRSIK